MTIVSSELKFPFETFHVPTFIRSNVSNFASKNEEIRCVILRPCYIFSLKKTMPYWKGELSTFMCSHLPGMSIVQRCTAKTLKNRVAATKISVNAWALRGSWELSYFWSGNHWQEGDWISFFCKNTYPKPFRNFEPIRRVQCTLMHSKQKIHKGQGTCSCPKH